MSDVEFPLYVEYEAPPSSSTLEQHVADRITGQTTTMHDKLFGGADASAAPNISTVPDAGIVYMVYENGDVLLGAIVVEDEGIVWSHDKFNINRYRETVIDDE